MRVTHVCPFIGEQMGGSERYVTNVARIQSAKHDVHVYTTTRYLNRVGTTRLKGVYYHRFFSPAAVWNMNPLSAILGPMLKSDCDVIHIHSHLYFISNQAALAAAITDRPCLLHIHGGVGSPPYGESVLKRSAKRFYDHTLGRFTAANAGLIASVSYRDLTHLPRLFDVESSRLRYLPNAVDLSEFSSFQKPLDRSNLVLLYLGDLEPWKGIGAVVNWIRNEDWSFCGSVTIRFVGQGSYLHELCEIQEKLKREKSPLQLDVQGPAIHRRVPSLLKAADALLFPSYWEGMPTVVLEAMACGTPVISTPVGDLRRVLLPLKNAFVINHGFGSFRNALLTLLESGERTRRMTNAARTLVERDYSLDAVCRRIDSVYSELLGV